MQFQQLALLVLALTMLIQFSSASTNYTDIVVKIKNAVKTNTSLFYHSAYNRLAYWTDTFGPRLWGSDNLELAINDLYSYVVASGFDNIALDPVTNFTAWSRGKEKLTLYDPRYFPQDLKVIGLGTSIPGNITGEVIVVRSWDELSQKSAYISGKILVYNQPWFNYSDSSAYRFYGASRASKYGAIAVLIRSVTPFSIESPHTGVQDYDLTYPKIPVACITVEDAEMFQRMQDRGQKIVVNLFLENNQFQANSRNLIAELQGTDLWDQIVLIGGHMDSWDVGSQTGANDDGGGVMSCIEAVKVLKSLGLRPRRTIRVIGWSGEEFGGTNNGAHQYVKLHSFEMSKHVVAMEDDLGSTTPYGFGITGSDAALAMIKNISSSYLYPINCTYVENSGGGSDTDPLQQLGIPTMSNVVQDTPNQDFYFTYHHSQGDSMTMMNPDQLDDNVIAIAAMYYIIADMNDTLPRVDINFQDFTKQKLFQSRSSD